MDQKRSGSCLCGKIRFETTGPLRDVIACHCSQCRKQSGHYYAATNVPDENLSIFDNGSLKWFQSSADAKRGFCRNCGSTLFWKLDSDPFTSVLAGAFENPTGLKLTKHIFVSDKADYYDIGDRLPQFEQSSASIKVSGS